jgi:hypothetical protein
LKKKGTWGNSEKLRESKSQDALVAPVGRCQVNECIRVASSGGIVVDVQEHGLAERSPDLSPYDGYFDEEVALPEPLEDGTVPEHQTASKRLTNSPISWRMALHSNRSV